jgi:hypothetical protein
MARPQNISHQRPAGRVCRPRQQRRISAARPPARAPLPRRHAAAVNGRLPVGGARAAGVFVYRRPVERRGPRVGGALPAGAAPRARASAAADAARRVRRPRRAAGGAAGDGDRECQRRIWRAARLPVVWAVFRGGARLVAGAGSAVGVAPLHDDPRVMIRSGEMWRSEFLWYRLAAVAYFLPCTALPCKNASFVCRWLRCISDSQFEECYTSVSCIYEPLDCQPSTPAAAKPPLPRPALSTTTGSSPPAENDFAT